MSVFSFITDIFKPASDIVDALHTSEEEKAQLRNQLAQIEAGVITTAVEFEKAKLEYETKIAEAQASVIKAEAQGASWMQRNWRPILMLEFGVIIAWNYIVGPLSGQANLPIPESMWTLLQLGVGGYILGRSAEKTLPELMRAIKEHSASKQ